MKKILMFIVILTCLLLTAATGYVYRDIQDRITANTESSVSSKTLDDITGSINSDELNPSVYDRTIFYTCYYDSYGRITGFSHPDKSGKHTYYYDKYGRMTGTSSLNESTRTAYFHDTNGQITGTSYTSESGETTDYYDAWGMMTGRSYSYGSGISYYYDEYGRMIGKSQEGGPYLGRKPYCSAIRSSFYDDDDYDDTTYSSRIISTNTKIDTLNIYYNN